jgi:hypothetical protein
MEIIVSQRPVGVDSSSLIETLNIPIYCPVPEDKYIVNGELLMEHSGAPHHIHSI